MARPPKHTTCYAAECRHSLIPPAVTPTRPSPNEAKFLRAPLGVPPPPHTLTCDEISWVALFLLVLLPPFSLLLRSVKISPLPSLFSPRSFWWGTGAGWNGEKTPRRHSGTRRKRLGGPLFPLSALLQFNLRGSRTEKNFSIDGDWNSGKKWGGWIERHGGGEMPSSKNTVGMTQEGTDEGEGFSSRKSNLCVRNPPWLDLRLGGGKDTFAGTPRERNRHVRIRIFRENGVKGRFGRIRR